MSELPYLKLVHNRRDRSIRLGSADIYCGGSTSSPPFPVDAQVVEEDTWQVLSADNQARESDEHPIRLMTGLIDQQPLAVGQLTVKGNHWQAVIIDLDQDPACQRDWVVGVYKQIIERAISDEISSISMPLLGVRHDCVSLGESLDILNDSIRLLQEDSLLRIWLELPEKDGQDAARLLDEFDNNK